MTMSDKQLENIQVYIAKVVPALVETGKPFSVVIRVDDEMYTSIESQLHAVEVFEPWEDSGCE